LSILLALTLTQGAGCTSEAVPAARLFVRALPTIASSLGKVKKALFPAENPHSTCCDTSAPTSTSIPFPSSGAGLTPTAQPWEGNLNLLLLGTDRPLGKPGGWRADAIILLSIDRASGTVYMISVPRDLWVSVAGYGNKRINTVDFLSTKTRESGDEFLLLKRTVKENLGIRVDHCVRIDFEGFRKAIDVLGGVTVDVECPLEDWFPDPASSSGWKRMSVPAGEQHMDGELALQYVRSRRGTDDFDRARRQQKVLLAMRDRALRLDTLPKLPALWESMRPTIQTDLSLSQILSLARLGAGMELEDVRGLVIDLSMTNNWTTPGGGEVLLVDPEKIEHALERLFTGPPGTSILSRPPICPRIGEAGEP